MPTGPPPPGGPPPPNAAVLLIALGRIWRERANAGLRAHGLSLRHLSALGHLSRQPGLSYSELGRRTGVTAQSVQATLLELERAGAVERRTDPGRGRRAALHLTEVGTRQLEAGQEVISTLEAELMAPLDPDERARLAGALFELLRRHETVSIE